ncbi:MAG: restriction endonuclease [Sphingobacteriales bacterium]|nr:restriction endonuclease [Sphingobacteriales bacterium]MBI3720332.1 restriction endonuclease [Sphingobacteriales bacterium]
MKISQKYSHLNGEEYLIVHHKKIYGEIIDVIEGIDASNFMTKKSKEKTMAGRMLYSPVELNNTFNKKFNALGWHETRYQYYVTTNPKLLSELINLPYDKQKEFLTANGVDEPISSYKQTDFVKNQIAVEIQFGKYAFVAFDLFVKHLLFYSGGVINLGIEVLPTKKMQLQMSSGVAYYEGEVYNVLRHGRNNPPVPLLILGIEP